MDFKLPEDLKLFETLFTKRPELSKQTLALDLKRYYLPFVQKLIELKKAKLSDEAFIVGISAIQGAGKTTQGEVLEILLRHLGYSSVSLSIDDHYITHKQLVELRHRDPRFIRRGVTHDIPLAILDLTALKKMSPQSVTLSSGYDKGANQGDGERFRWVNIIDGLTVKAKVVEEELVINQHPQIVKAIQLQSLSYKGQPVDLLNNMGSDVPITAPLLPRELVQFLEPLIGQELTITRQVENITFEASSDVVIPVKNLPNGWRVVDEKPDFILYDGWMLGVQKVEDESVFDQSLPGLETVEAKQFAKDINRKLFDYELLWQMFDFLNLLYVPNYQVSIEWRDQAEEALRAKGEGMSKAEIVEFVHYFWRSIHPAIHIKKLSRDDIHTQQVVVINDDHSIKEILTPTEIAQKY